MDLTIPSRRYPVGIQDFPKLRNGGFVYVDKTDYIWRLAHENGSSFFLSRPRRFGKSMLVSTMHAYFEGRRELFSGTVLERMETEWKAWPVIRLDLSTVKTRDLNGLRSLLDSLLRRLEAVFHVERVDDMPGARLETLIRSVIAQTGKQVVVLVDEYDAPLLNVIDDPEQLDAFRQVMREFYIPLKACDADLRFVFLTGITKFSQLSIFSELNNLTNISMDPAYAGICGITAEELDSEMEEDVEALAERLNVDPPLPASASRTTTTVTISPPTRRTSTTPSVCFPPLRTAALSRSGLARVPQRCSSTPFVRTVGRSSTLPR